MTEKEKLDFCIYALRIVALSYRQRIDARDTAAWVFADEILKYLGQDIEQIPPENEQLESVISDFRKWRRGKK